MRAVGRCWATGAGGSRRWTEKEEGMDVWIQDGGGFGQWRRRRAGRRKKRTSGGRRWASARWGRAADSALQQRRRRRAASLEEGERRWRKLGGGGGRAWKRQPTTSLKVGGGSDRWHSMRQINTSKESRERVYLFFINILLSIGWENIIT
ncbi:hypothetical protein BS78_02G122100 [Paspalum vaginatum]|nr:hypothetical protein BS78_02G122100 [Paspalum vaginatum]